MNLPSIRPVCFEAVCGRSNWGRWAGKAKNLYIGLDYLFSSSCRMFVKLFMLNHRFRLKDISSCLFGFLRNRT